MEEVVKKDKVVEKGGGAEAALEETQLLQIQMMEKSCGEGEDYCSREG